MAPFIQAFAEAVRNSFCDAAATNQTLFPLLFGTPGLAVGGGFGFLYNQFCNAPPPDFSPALPAPQFAGGQCPGIGYRVEIDWTYYNTVTQQPTTVNYVSNRSWGPIGKVQTSNDGSQEGITFTSATGSNNPTRLVNGAGSVGYNASRPIEINDVRVTRNDGAADNCGSLPSEQPELQPGDNIVNNNVTYVTNEGNTITIPVVLAFGYAQVNANAEITIPVTANFNLNPELNVDGTFNFNTGDFTPNPPGSPTPPGSGKPCSPPVGTDTDPPDAPDGIDETDPPDPLDPPETKYERIMLGALVTVTELGPTVSIIPQGANPDIIIPDAGLLSFEVRVGNKSGWLEDIRVKNRRQFCPCPWEGGAIAVRGTPRVGFEFTITPVYVKATPQQLYPPA